MRKTDYGALEPLKRLGNMSSSIRRFRLQLDLPIFLANRRPFLAIRRPRQRGCGCRPLSVVDAYDLYLCQLQWPAWA